MRQVKKTSTIDRSCTARPGNFWWLVAAPTCIAFGAWFIPDAVRGRDGLLLPSMIAVSGVTPLAGFLLVLLYIWRSQDWRQLWPYLPFVFVATAFAVSMVVLALTMPRDESQDAMIPVAQVMSGFIQPWLALVGGLISFLVATRRRPS